MTKAERIRKYTQRYDELKAQLNAVGFVCKGSVHTRRMECGKAPCRCHDDPQNRHGPYHYWTRKAHGKTVGLMLTDDELPVYREWIENNRNLQRILREMHTVSSRVLTLTTGRKAP